MLGMYCENLMKIKSTFVDIIVYIRNSYVCKTCRVMTVSEYDIFLPATFTFVIGISYIWYLYIILINANRSLKKTTYNIPTNMKFRRLQTVYWIGGDF